MNILNNNSIMSTMVDTFNLSQVGSFYPDVYKAHTIVRLYKSKIDETHVQTPEEIARDLEMGFYYLKPEYKDRIRYTSKTFYYWAGSTDWGWFVSQGIAATPAIPGKNLAEISDRYAAPMDAPYGFYIGYDVDGNTLLIPGTNMDEVKMLGPKEVEGYYVYENREWVRFGGSPIDEKTIIKNEDPDFAEEGNIRTAVGGWAEDSFLIADSVVLTIDSPTADGLFKVPLTITENQLKSYDGPINVVIRDVTNDVEIRNYSTHLYGNGGLWGDPLLVGFKCDFFTGGIMWQYGDDTFTAAYSKDPASPNYNEEIQLNTEYLVKILFGTDKAYHKSDARFIDIDETTTSLNSMNKLMAKSAIVISEFPEDYDAVEEVIYRLIEPCTIDGVVYNKGLYVCDKHAEDPSIGIEWISVGSSIDHKTIIDEGSGEQHTAVGGWKEAINEGDIVSGSVFTWENAFNNTIKMTWNMNYSYDQLSPFTENAHVTITCVEDGTVIYDAVSTFYGNGGLGGSSSARGMAVPAEVSSTLKLVCTGTYEFDHQIENYISCDPTHPSYSPLYQKGKSYKLDIVYVGAETSAYIYHKSDANFIDTDEITTTLDDDDKLFAKSAIEIDAFPLYALAREEAIYHLNAPYEIDDVKYSKGLYICKKTAAPVEHIDWYKVGVANDEKTIIDNEDGKVETAIGGWREGDEITETLLIANVGITLPTDILSSPTCTRNIVSPKTADEIAALDGNGFLTITKDSSTLAEYKGLSNIVGNNVSVDSDVFTIVYKPELQRYCLTIVDTTNLGFFEPGEAYTVRLTYIESKGIYHPFDARFAPIDKTTIVLKSNKYKEHPELDEEALLKANSIIYCNGLPFEGEENVIYYTVDDKESYIYYDDQWVKFSNTKMFTDVKVLPDSAIELQSIYRVLSAIVTDLTTWKLSADALAAGWSVVEDGLNDGTTVHTWAQILADPSTYFDVLLVPATDDATVFRYKDDGVEVLTSIEPEEKILALKYYYKDEWHDFSSQPIVDVGFEDLPDDPVIYSFYKQKIDVYELIDRYNLSADSIAAGYSIAADGLHFEDPVTHEVGETVNWGTINEQWVAAYGVMFASNADGAVFRYNYNEITNTSFGEPDHPPKIVIKFYDELLGWQTLFDSLAGGGTNSYVNLNDKPKLNDITILGEKTSEDYALFWYGTREEYDAIAIKNEFTTYYINDEESYEELVDYEVLDNKPEINGVELIGDKNTEDLKISWHGTQAEYDTLPVVNSKTFYIIDDGEASVETNNYLDLGNKPKLNGVELTGDKSAADINMYDKDEIDNLISSMRSINVVSEEPSSPSPNTLYYISADLQPPYNVVLFNNNLIRIPMGTSEIDMSQYQTRSEPSLNTSSKNISGAINEINERVGNSVLTTVAKNATAGINELDMELGDLSLLSTESKSSLVSATNEVKAMFGPVIRIEKVTAMPATPVENVLYIVV